MDVSEMNFLFTSKKNLRSIQPEMIILILI